MRLRRLCRLWALTLLSILFADISHAVAGPAATPRQERFLRWQQAHRDVESRIASLKRESSLQVARFQARQEAEVAARQRAIAAAGAGLTAAQKRQADEMVQVGRNALTAGNCDAAAAAFQRAIAINPAQPKAHNGMAECLRKQGKLAEAAAWLTRTTRLPPIDGEIESAQLTAMMTLQTLPPPPDPEIAAAPVIFRIAGAPAEVWDHPDAPEMVIIPAGQYTMGSPPDEIFANGTETQHRVTIGYPLAIGKYNVTRGEFAAFVAATGYDANGGFGCNAEVDSKFMRTPTADWRSPGFPQSDEDPVVCMNYYDASAFADWLTKVTGHKYRLPSEAEWEYAVRAGTTTIYYWGDAIGTGHANCDGCNGPEHERRTTPGGTYPPNAFGLYDMSGNVWKWFSDCWNSSYVGAPGDGSSWQGGNCALRGRRSGSWFNLSDRRPGDPREPGRLRAAGRFGSIPELRYSSYGFRVVREL